MESGNILNSKWKVSTNMTFFSPSLVNWNCLTKRKCMRMTKILKVVFFSLQKQEELMYIMTYDVLFGKVSSQSPCFFLLIEWNRGGSMVVSGFKL